MLDKRQQHYKQWKTARLKENLLKWTEIYNKRFVYTQSIVWNYVHPFDANHNVRIIQGLWYCSFALSNYVLYTTRIRLPE